MGEVVQFVLPKKKKPTETLWYLNLGTYEVEVADFVPIPNKNFEQFYHATTGKNCYIGINVFRTKDGVRKRILQDLNEQKQKVLKLEEKASQI